MKTSQKPLQVLAALTLITATGALATLSGCGGANLGNEYYNADSGIFYSADQPLGNGFARNVIELRNGIPLRLGIEITPAALNNLPDVPEDQAAAPFISPLPPKTHATPLTSDVLVYSSGHEPPNTATPEPAHFHLTFIIRPLLQTSPPYTLELKPIAANEMPQGTVRVVDELNPQGVVVPGIGVSVDDPAQPSNRPPLTTLGQNFFFFDGHLNAYALGPTIDFLRSKQVLKEAIKQPQVYPRGGYYPYSWSVRFDSVRNVHVIELTDFRLAQNVVPPGT